MEKVSALHNGKLRCLCCTNQGLATLFFVEFFRIVCRKNSTELIEVNLQPRFTLRHKSTCNKKEKVFFYIAEHSKLLAAKRGDLGHGCRGGNYYGCHQSPYLYIVLTPDKKQVEHQTHHFQQEGNNIPLSTYSLLPHTTRGETMYQAIIVDQWHLTSTGINGLLENLSLFRTIQTVSGFSSVLPVVDSIRPDICIVNLSSFPIHFQEITQTIQRHSPRTKIIVFSTRSEHPFYVQSLRAGAHCCISLETDKRDIRRAIRYALRNEKFICPTVMRHLPDTFEQNPELVHLRFSVKELQVFLLVGQGKSTHEIALELHVSDQTVSTYKNRIFRKSNFKTNTSILTYIQKHGLAS